MNRHRTQNFADAVKEFGFDEEHLEEEWDTNIEAAEAEAKPLTTVALPMNWRWKR